MTGINSKLMFDGPIELRHFYEWTLEDMFYIQAFSAIYGTLVEEMELDQKNPGFIYWFDNNPEGYSIDEIQEELIYGLK